MNSLRISTSLAAISFAALLAGACSKGDQATPADSAAAAMPIPADTAPKALEVGDIDMGRHVGPDQKITDKTDDFAPMDTIFASVDTKNAGTGTLTARWTFEDGTVVQEQNQTISPTGDASTEFHIVKAGGWPAGKYTLHLLLNNAEIKTKDVTVKK